MELAEPVRALRRGGSALAAGAWRDRWLYAVAGGVCAAGFALGPVTGRHPDWALVKLLGGRLLLTGAAAALLLLVIVALRLALVVRHPAPLRAMRDAFAAALGREGRAVGALNTLVIFLLFATGFAVLKGAIAIVAPFRWDAALAALDHAVHFGRAPHEWLWPLVVRPRIVFALNCVYNAWFFAVVAGFLAAGCAGGRSALRRQYLMSFMLVWVIGGFLVAIAVSSAGPCFYARIGLGDLYGSLMRQLAADAVRAPVFSLATQDMLWAGFTGARPGSAGISAFPSMHVATATLFLLAARRLGRWPFAAAAVFWAAILAGSVVLGWHYAVDGYAGTLLSLAVWRAVGRLSGARGRATRGRGPAPGGVACG